MRSESILAAMKKLRLLFVVATLLMSVAAIARDYDYMISSPDGRLTVCVTVNNQLCWSVNLDGKPMLIYSPIGLETTADTFGKNVKVTKAADKKLKDFGSLTLTFRGGYSVEWRAYDDAGCYRITLPKGKKVTVKNEIAQFRFNDDDKCFVPYVNDLRDGDKWSSAFECYYDHQKLSEMYNDSLAITPFAVCHADGYKSVILETGVKNYPGMYLVKGEGNSLTAKFPNVPLKWVKGGMNDLNMMATERAGYIAKDAAQLPWRVVMAVSNDAQLLGNDIVSRLGAPGKLTDTSWIRPGKAAWDWWNNWNISGVDFRAGINTDTYLYYIDFAHDNGLEYAVLDEGWSDPEDLMKMSDKMDISKIVDYAKERGVSIILWSSWRNMVQRGAQKMDEVMDYYSRMGVKGFKVDFFDRDDQLAVNSAYQVAEAAARHHLILDLHGFKPNGMQTEYPNILNFEGVKGLENSKWEPKVDGHPLHDQPLYDVSIPYLRNLIGPMDYTPGAMVNATPDQFYGNNAHPMSQGTRVHQMAMYVVFYGPLQMLADSPTKYKKEQECTNFIDGIPTVWDETVPLSGKMGEYVALARRKGNVWYVGAMTNGESRDLTLDLSKLKVQGKTMDIFGDGVNADREATDYAHLSATVAADGIVNVHLAPGGGWVCRISQ